MRLAICPIGHCATTMLRLLGLLPFALITIPVAAAQVQENLKRFELLIVDPDGQPVPHVAVEVPDSSAIICSPFPKPRQTNAK